MSDRCEEVLPALAAGGPIRRWRARRHAARCPRCAAAQDELRQVAGALADVAPLTVAQRRLWVAAARDEIPTGPLKAWWSRPAVAGALATVIVGAVGVWWEFHPVDRQQGPSAVSNDNPPAVRERLSRDVAVLRNRVVTLAQELDDLRRRAELLDARKDVDAIMARLVPEVGVGGL